MLRQFILASVLLALAPLAAFAQSCNGPVRLPRDEGRADPSEKFRLIAQQCDILAEPVTVRHAAQLDLYDGRGPVAIQMTSSEAVPAEVPPARQQSAAPLSPPTRDETRVMVLAPAVTAAARAYGLDPLLMHAIAHVESRHNPQAVSPVGARGAMQVTPATARRFGVTDPERTLFDADTNVRASAALLQTLEQRYHGDTRLVLAAYNAGEAAVEKYGHSVPPYPETEAYVRDVMAIHRRLTDEFQVTADGAIVARPRS
jgi:soluble lytic murein transglycosylase-like protein